MRFSKYSRWQPKKQERVEPEKRQTLDDFLTGVLIDVCRSRASGASITWEYAKIGGASDGSIQYRLDVDYTADRVRGQHYSDDSISVDKGENPHDPSDYIMGVLYEHNVLSEREGRCILMNTKPLHQLDGAEKIATILNTGADKPVSTANVVDAYRRIYAREPAGFCMDAYVLFEVGEALGITDQEILRRFRMFNTKPKN